MNQQDKAKAAIEWTQTRVEKPNVAMYPVSQDILILELLRPLAAGTHVLAPKEPTEAMLDAGVEASSEHRVSVIYRAMLTASQEQE